VWSLTVYGLTTFYPSKDTKSSGSPKPQVLSSITENVGLNGATKKGNANPTIPLLKITHFDELLNNGITK